MEIFLFCILLFAVLITFATIIFLVLMLHGAWKGGAPFVPVRDRVTEKIVESLRLTNNAQFLDLGSGDGRIIFEVLKQYPGVTAVGYEWQAFPFLISKMKNTYLKQNATFLCQDFFKADFRKHTHVFTYLFPSVMDALLPKLSGELPKGARLVSCDFEFSQKKPVEIISLELDPKNPLCKKLFVYEF